MSDSPTPHTEGGEATSVGWIDEPLKPLDQAYIDKLNAHVAECRRRGYVYVFDSAPIGPREADSGWREANDWWHRHPDGSV